MSPSGLKEPESPVTVWQGVHSDCPSWVTCLLGGNSVGVWQSTLTCWNYPDVSLHHPQGALLDGSWLSPSAQLFGSILSL